jgi:hypothetical protein
MVESSTHLDKIIAKYNRKANLQVIFVDIEKYSKRRSLTQISVIDSFTNTLKESLNATSQKFSDYIKINKINFQSDIIKIPTGDGAAIVFSFEGLPDIHLYFAKKILQNINVKNLEEPCHKFDEDGWCNCHSNYHVRIGISEDRGIIYKDLNENYNVAGNGINMASRVMGLADRSQILFTYEAYRQIVDMVDDPFLDARFREYKNVEVKHGVKLNIYQYIEESQGFINSSVLKDIESINRDVSIINKIYSDEIELIDTELSHTGENGQETLGEKLRRIYLDKESIAQLLHIIFAVMSVLKR